MNNQVHPYELRVAWHNLRYQLQVAMANSEDVSPLFDELVSDEAIVDELERAFRLRTDLRLVDQLDLQP